MTYLRTATAGRRVWRSGSARAYLHRAWFAFRDWYARRLTVKILSSLDERTLRDIGITPGEITSVVYGKRGERCRAYDDLWWWR
jgi:uncharacterized protein YjiS (DUF1127 family)